MKSLNKYVSELQSFISCRRLNIPANVTGIDGVAPTWDDPVWYIKDQDTGVMHRYLFTKAFRGSRRQSKDAIFRELSNYETKLFLNPYSSILKIYALEIQSINIVNNSKQQRVVIASQILTEAQKCDGLNNISIEFWNSTTLGNLFWDFCKRNKLVSGHYRPIHKDRERGADISAERSNEHLKMTSTSMIYALGDIFNTVFKNVDKNGIIEEGAAIDIQDAITISVALLGLASPNRLNSEVPRLQNQKLKMLRPKIGEPIYYLDWPGSKGFQDNQNHVLRVLAPQVKKSINFFHYYFMPERHFVRFLKDRKLTWNSILEGFIVDEARMKYLDFKIPPNMFSVAYALGFFPVTYYVPVVRCCKFVEPNDSSSRVKFPYLKKWNNESGRRYKVNDFFYKKNIAQLSPNDILLNLTGPSERNGVYSALKSVGINAKIRDALSLSLITNVKELENGIISIITNEIPTFPISYAESEQGLDLEYALFCVSPAKHGIPTTKGMAGSPLNIHSISKIKSMFVNRLLGPEKTKHLNIFYKYGFGFQKLRLHSLRHFSNTEAEKGGIPLSVIAVWSGRTSIKQTLEYIHTSNEDKADRLISTLDLGEKEEDIRIISREELKNSHAMPASATETGICVQELSVTPCNYINDFLSGCFGCESACYICGDLHAIQMFEYDLEFQKARLERLKKSNGEFVSKAKKDWWIKHSLGTYLLEQLIAILKEQKHGHVVRISRDGKQFYITNLKTKDVSEQTLSLPSEKKLLEEFNANIFEDNSVPKSMGLILNSYGLGEKNNYGTKS